MKTKSFLTLLSFCLLFLLPLSLCAQEPVCGKCYKKKSLCPYSCNHPKCKTCGKFCGARVNPCPYGGKHPKCDACGKLKENCAYKGKHPKCNTCGELRENCSYGGNHPTCSSCGKFCGAKMNPCPYGGKHPKCSVCGNLKENCAYKGNHPKCPTCGKLKESCPYRGNHPLCAICGKVMEDCQYGGNHPICPDCGKLIERCDYGGDHPKCNTCGELKENCPYRGDHPKDRGRHAGHEWVDLGLSVKWATCNVGANTPEEYGNYYAWGETSTKSSYDEDNCKTWNRSMSDIRGNSSYDAARANWGGSWRLPTKAECDELVNNCTRQWTTQNGVKGMRLTSKRNGNSIFFPAAGWLYGTSTYDAGEYGFYWSSTPYESTSQLAYSLCFGSGGSAGTGWYGRSSGRQVRPVLE